MASTGTMPEVPEVLLTGDMEMRMQILASGRWYDEPRMLMVGHPLGVEQVNLPKS